MKIKIKIYFLVSLNFALSYFKAKCVYIFENRKKFFLFGKYIENHHYSENFKILHVRTRLYMYSFIWQHCKRRSRDQTANQSSTMRQKKNVTGIDGLPADIFKYSGEELIN